MRWLVGAVAVVVAVGSPVAIYYGLQHYSVRQVSLFALAVAVALLFVRFRRVDRKHLRAVLRIPAVVLALIGLSAVLDDPRFMLALPSLINVAMFVTFASTLRGPITLVERFARLQLGDDIDARQIAHCRQATVAWCAFFLFNASAAGALVLWAPLAWWAAYNSSISYGLMGVMFAGEYIVRQYRFRSYGRGLHDRLLSLLFPPEAPE